MSEPDPAHPDPSFLERLWARYASDGGDELGDADATLPPDFSIADALRAPTIAHDSAARDSEDDSPRGAEPGGLIAGRYRLDGELARGGMGKILRVWDETIRRDLAMKVMVEEAQDRPEFVGRFIEEAQVTGQLEHPGIVPVHEIGFDSDGQLYFTMRLVRGHDLRTVFRWVREDREEWTRTRAVTVLIRVCEALAYAHSRGVIHRDLNPANIMVGSFGEVYVMDWGLAKLRGDAGTDDAPEIEPHDPADSRVMSDRLAESSAGGDSPFVTAAGSVVGTPAYMAPEQAEGDLDAVDARADVYAAGAILYTLLTDRLPYVEPESTPPAYAIVDRVRSGPPIPIAEITRKASPELIAIAETAMARRPDDRYPDMQAMARDLRAYLEERVVNAYETGAWAEFRKWVKRNRTLALTAGAFLFILTVGSGLFSWYTDRQYREIIKLEDLKRLEELIAESETLYPPLPRKLAALENWIRRADTIAARREQHARTLAQIREDALPYRAEDRARDYASHPDHAEWQRWQSIRDRIERKIERAVATGDTAAEAQHRGNLPTAIARVDTLFAEVDTASRRHYRFDDPVLQWRHDGLRDLVSGLDRLTADDRSLRLYADVVARRNSARDVRELTIEGPAAAAAWNAAITAIRSSARYGGLEFTPQLGLVPLGENPATGLWEFWHPLSGKRPEASMGDDATSASRWRVAGNTGLVFVLIPGGAVTIGDASIDRASPPHEVTLEPYFISKYEMTQGQWRHFTQYNPSFLDPDHRPLVGGEFENRFTHAHPVETVTWTEAQRELRRMGLSLPTEAQWEHAARGGSTTRWYFGDEPSGVRDRANLVDVAYNA
ncbi:MAG: bifunctional serine/threonine-protein kinase/formylglycine-generating enzyme family protein, partial [Planctomycetota bacterium]